MAKVRFKDLSIPLKIAAFVGIVNAIAFVVGLIVGVLGVFNA